MENGRRVAGRFRITLNLDQRIPAGPPRFAGRLLASMRLGIPPPTAFGKLRSAPLDLGAGQVGRFAEDVRIAEDFSDLAVDAAGHLHDDVFTVVEAGG